MPPKSHGSYVGRYQRLRALRKAQSEDSSPSEPSQPHSPHPTPAHQPPSHASIASCASSFFAFPAATVPCRDTPPTSQHRTSPPSHPPPPVTTPDAVTPLPQLSPEPTVPDPTHPPPPLDQPPGIHPTLSAAAPGALLPAPHSHATGTTLLSTSEPTLSAQPSQAPGALDDEQVSNPSTPTQQSTQHSH
eukprot:Sspe_Gene.91445::Locus_62934_Transcript_1_1_Confidence_1.000_Length_595::g.91445::m.91445